MEADEAALEYDRAMLPLTRRLADEILPQLGDTVLLYRRSGAGVVLFARARAAAIEAPGPSLLLCRLEELARFGVATVEPLADGPSGGLLLLSDERFDEILRLSGSPSPYRLEIDEGSVPFVHHGMEPGLLLDLHDEVLRRWNYRCSVTGAQFAPAARPHPDLRLVPIRPFEKGGTTTVRNILPMVPLAEDAWRRGVIGVGPDLWFVAAIDAVDPELLAYMLRAGGLIVPDNPDYRPAAEHLAFHRMHVLGT